MKSDLTFEIHGTGTHNRGAELMALAIRDRLRGRYPGCRIVVPPTFGAFGDRARCGFWTTWDLPGRYPNGPLLRLCSKALRDYAGIVDPRSVDAVFDASGFAYSDQWGTYYAKTLLSKMSKRDRSNQPLILMPQAFGPFTNAEVADLTGKLIQRARLVMVRDAQSMEAVRGLGSFDHLRGFPDFTTSLKAVEPDGIPVPDRFVAVIPNMRMLDQRRDQGEYLTFLEHVVSSLQAKGYNLALVLHTATSDREVSEVLASRGIQIPVMTHADPLALKWVIGQASFVVGSRFHGLVNALSQAVPAIGTSWSHKYQELFSDFDSSDLLISDLKRLDQFDEIVDALSQEEQRNSISDRIRRAGDGLRKQTDKMWSEIFEVINSEISN